MILWNFSCESPLISACKGLPSPMHARWRGTGPRPTVVGEPSWSRCERCPRRRDLSRKCHSTVARGPVPRECPVDRSMARDRPSPYGGRRAFLISISGRRDLLVSLLAAKDRGEAAPPQESRLRRRYRAEFAEPARQPPETSAHSGFYQRKISPPISHR